MARRQMTIRRLDPWSVLKFGLLANLCLLGVGLAAAFVVWFVVMQLGLVAKTCGIAEQLGFENCGVDTGNLFRALGLLGLLGVIVQTGLYVLGAFLYNLIADLVGGLQIGVVDTTAPRSMRGDTGASAAARGDADRARGSIRGSDGGGAGRPAAQRSTGRDVPPVPPLGTERTQVRSRSRDERSTSAGSTGADTETEGDRSSERIFGERARDR